MKDGFWEAERLVEGMKEAYREAQRRLTEQAFSVYRGGGAGLPGDGRQPDGEHPEARKAGGRISEALRQWREEGQRQWAQGHPEPAEYLIRLLGLDEFEQFCLAVLTEAEIDSSAMRRELGDCGLDKLSPVSLMSLYEGRPCFDGEKLRRFLKGGRLWGWILEKTGPDGPGPGEAVRLDGRIRNLILADQWEDEEIREYGFWIYGDQVPDNEMKGRFGEKEYRQWSGVMKGDGAVPMCLIKGPGGIGKKTQVRRFARESGIPVFCGDTDAFQALSGQQQQDLVWRMVRECRISQAVLCLERREAGSGDWPWAKEACRLAGQYLPGFVVLLPEKSGCPEGLEELLPVSVAMPCLREAEEIWRETKQDFPCGDDVRPEELAGITAMTPGQIRRAFVRAQAIMRREGASAIEERHIREACRSLAEGKLGNKAVSVPVRYGFEDLVLPGEQKQQLREVCSQAKNRYHVYEKWGFSGKNAYGTGISIVFSGAPGTGKTMAAQIMAGQLGLELYKIDLSAVVSKYIGETEKNLELIFTEGRKSQAVLFFDEADALFSRRTEVKDSNDKYSNMEVAFLLQKMEEYTGVAILATNYLRNMDEAFKRRMTCIIEFPFPDRECRRQLWQKAAPEELPLAEEVDFDFLAAGFELSGSQIKNSLIHAAFLAAETGQEQVGMKHIFRAMEQELQKSGRKLAREDCGEYGYLFEEEGET